MTVNFIDTLAVTLVAIVPRNKKRDPCRVSFVSLSFPSCLSILLPNILARNRVWLDKDEIRPGDLFAKALEQGLAASRAVALVVSPEAMASGWVEREYYRAL